MYDTVFVKDLMFMPSPLVTPEESMEEVARKFKVTSHYNLPVVDKGKYDDFEFHLQEYG